MISTQKKDIVPEVANSLAQSFAEDTSVLEDATLGSIVEHVQQSIDSGSSAVLHSAAEPPSPAQEDAQTCEDAQNNGDRKGKGRANEATDAFAQDPDANGSLDASRQAVQW